MDTAVEISDIEFIEEFENQTLSPTYFDHIGHLRLAWLYVITSPLEEALSKTCNGIKAYAVSLGATDKYYSTITHALVRIVADRVGQSEVSNIKAFLEDNSDLVDDCIEVLTRYYSKELLFSEEAKQAYVVPDLKKLP